MASSIPRLADDGNANASDDDDDAVDTGDAGEVPTLGVIDDNDDGGGGVDMLV
jgi:hypothetical protein